MEVSTTDESEKIRALVGDKALPTTDPNQCLLCRRVLSCKSALQMHYRTHTGSFLPDSGLPPFSMKVVDGVTLASVAVFSPCVYKDLALFVTLAYESDAGR